jgi:hypothetical protein
MDDVTRALVAIESALALDVGDHGGDPECRYCHEPYVREIIVGRFTSRHASGCAYRSAVDAYLRSKEPIDSAARAGAMDSPAALDAAATLATEVTAAGEFLRDNARANDDVRTADELLRAVSAFRDAWTRAAGLPLDADRG